MKEEKLEQIKAQINKSIKYLETIYDADSHVENQLKLIKSSINKNISMKEIIIYIDELIIDSRCEDYNFRHYIGCLESISEKLEKHG